MSISGEPTNTIACKGSTFFAPLLREPHKGLTATPTAAVVFALFAPVMLVQFAMDKATSLQVHGVQDHHLLVCEAVGIDPAWYQGGATGQNSLPRATPP
jgi:hypothetical protein